MTGRHLGWAALLCGVAALVGAYPLGLVAVLLAVLSARREQRALMSAAVGAATGILGLIAGAATLARMIESGL